MMRCAARPSGHNADRPLPRRPIRRPNPNGGGLRRLVHAPLLFLSATLINGPLTEEPGWRGFLLPRLQSKYAPLTAVLIVGAIWATWHLPLLLSDPADQRPAQQFVAMVLAQSVVFAWVYNGTRGSVLLVFLMHGSANTIAKFLVPIVMGDAAHGVFWWLLAALWWVVAFVVVAVIGMARDRVPSMGTPAVATSAARVTRGSPFLEPRKANFGELAFHALR
jgi:uncharacterized protein